jgi:hypothetical protein
MADIDQDRRNYLTTKWPELIAPRPPDPALDDRVQTILDAEQIVDRQGWARRIGAWVDPAHNPRMYDIVTNAHRQLRAAMAAGEIDYDDHAAEGYPYHPDDPADSAVLIHFVGSNSVSVCKRPVPGRAERGVPYHTGLLQLYAQVYDQYRRGDCQINIADDCGQGRIGGLTNMMVLGYGAFVLVFRCCESCDLAARETAEVGYKLGVIAAHERLADMPLPPWARTAPWWLRWRASWARFVARVTGPTAP